MSTSSALPLACILIAGCQAGTLGGAGDELGAAGDSTPGDSTPNGDEATGDAVVGISGLYLRGAAIFTATGSTLLLGQAITVRGDTITAIAPEESPVPPGLTVMDLDGLTLLPGLVDNHVHLATNNLATVPDDLNVFLDWGVTTIRDLASPQDDILGFRDRVAAGSLPGPRIRAAGAAYTAPNGHPIPTIWPTDPVMVAAALRVVDDAATARSEVDLSWGAGVDLIKIVLTDCFGGGCSRMASDVFAAVVDQAHIRGLQVVVHTDSTDDVAEAIAAGVEGVEHGFTETDPLAGQINDLVANNIAVVPTISAATGYSPSTLDEIRARTLMMHQAGVRIVVGTDDQSPVNFGFSVHNEMAHLVAAGLTPAEALVCATRYGAEHAGLGAELGTLEVGKLADIVAIDGDPLVDIHFTQNVISVVMEGIVVR